MLNGTGTGSPIGGPWPMAYALGYESTGDTYMGDSAGNHFVDGPYNSLATLQYYVQAFLQNGGIVQLNRDGASKSSITVMEIKQ
jgi:hypothetical protein